MLDMLNRRDRESTAFRHGTRNFDHGVDTFELAKQLPVLAGGYLFGGDRPIPCGQRLDDPGGAAERFHMARSR